MLGQLQDAGNTTTLAHYLDLLAARACGWPAEVRARRGAAARVEPEAAGAQHGADDGAKWNIAVRSPRRPAFWGHLVESAVGAHLANGAVAADYQVFYWRDRNREVDFVVRAGKHLTAMEVKSGRLRDTLPGLAAFGAAFPKARKLLVGADGIAVEEFLGKPPEHWVRG